MIGSPPGRVNLDCPILLQAFKETSAVTSPGREGRESYRTEAGKEAAGTGIGAPVRRVEDRRFITGKGDFVDDFALPNMAFAYVVRSPHAHARIVGIDKGAACAAPGVFGVLTGQDVIAENIKGLPCPGFPVAPQEARFYRPLRPVLPLDFVRHVGDGVALII